jgi:hypothetical protein
MRKELSVHQVIGFWYDTIAGVVRSPQRSLPDRLSDWVFDAKATRTICKMIVEEFPSYNQPVARALRAHHEGTDNFDHVELCADFVGELGVWLQSNPAYPCYKEEGSRIEPQEYNLDALASQLGYASRSAAQYFMDNHGYHVPGVGKMGRRWYMCGSTIDALKILRKKSESENFLEDISSRMISTTEGVNASEAA